MLYKFKSPIAADVLMLEPHAQQILEIIGKPPGSSGIVTAAQAPAALQALDAAIAAEERVAPPAHGGSEAAESDIEGDGVARRGEQVSLRRRAAPFIDLLRRTAAQGKDVVWGV